MIALDPPRPALEALGYSRLSLREDDPRRGQWAEERAAMGFDSRDTWDLGLVMVELLYERLDLYLERAASRINLTLHQLEHRGETITQEEALARLLSYCEFILLAEDQANTLEEEAAAGEAVVDLWQLWASASRFMWW